MKLIELLGLPRLQKGGAKVPTASGTTQPGSASGNAAPIKPGSAAGNAMAADATKYAAAKQAAIDVLGTLTEPSAAAEKKKIVTDLVLVAAAKAQGGDFAAGTALLQQVAGRVTAAKQAAAAAFADYDQKRDAAQKLLDALRKHAQQARIATQIGDAAAKLAGAKIFADKGDYGTAKTRVEEARVICVAAKLLADQFDAVARKRATAGAMLDGVRGIMNDAGFAQYPPFMNVIDGEIAANPPKLADASAKLDQVVASLGSAVNNWYSIQSKARLVKLKARKGAAFVDADIKQLDALQAEADAAIAAKNWNKAVMTGRGMSSMFAPIERTADRRFAYDTQRPLTVNAIAPLRARSALATLVVGLDKSLAEADALATREAMRFEQGVEALKTIALKCKAAGPIGDTAEAYVIARAAVDKDLALLQSDKAAAKLKPTLDAIVAQLAAATLAATEAGTAAEPLPKWQAAAALVAAATADLAAAKKLAAGLGTALEAGASAAGAKDIAGLQQSLASLGAEGQAAQKAAGADAAADAFKTFAAALKLAQTAADGNDLKAGAAQAAKAADLLLAAKTIQAQHGDYLALRKTVEDRRKAIAALPTAISLKPLLKEVDDALIDAATRDAAHDAASALAAVRKAADAATRAEQAAVQRKAFDDRAKTTDVAIKAVTDVALRNELQQRLVAATNNADSFHFAMAGKSLDGIDVSLDGKKAEGLAKSNPNSADLRAAVQRMMAKGGDDEVDALMASLPDTVDTKVLVTLAKERFGVDLVVDATDPQEAKTIKQMCSMLAKVPHDTKKSPSLKKVAHEKPGTNGGAYGSEDGGVITMNGRPKQSMQKFGSQQQNPDGTPELPDDVDPNCQPKDEKKIDYFDFATLHEVGHSVDDAQNFMTARRGVAEFGGWMMYGGKVEPIAEAVAKFCKYDKTPEQKKYVLDKIMRMSPTPPVAPAGEEVEWQTNLNAVDEWHKIAASQQVWWRQGDCDKITIDGRIYHEAYDQNWVSYLASARKGGITGYQFRAPAEWFAELYATFHMDKLKPSHPATKWLAKLAA
jgi:hypothetical protein